MKLTLASGGPHTAGIDVALVTLAVLLMLGSAAMLLAEIGSAGIWIPVIGIGLALVTIVQRRQRT